MTAVLAAEGGFQQFTLGSAEYLWLYFSVASAVLALLVGFVLRRGVLAADQGTDEMQRIAGAIQEGAAAYLRRQFRTIGIILVPVAALVFLVDGHDRTLSHKLAQLIYVWKDECHSSSKERDTQNITDPMKKGELTS